MSLVMGSNFFPNVGEDPKVGRGRRDLENGRKEGVSRA